MVLVWDERKPQSDQLPNPVWLVPQPKLQVVRFIQNTRANEVHQYHQHNDDTVEKLSNFLSTFLSSFIRKLCVCVCGLIVSQKSFTISSYVSLRLVTKSVRRIGQANSCSVYCTIQHLLFPKKSNNNS